MSHRYTLKELKAMGLQIEGVTEPATKTTRAKNGRGEDDFLKAVIKYARLKGWRTAHFRHARTEHGWRTAVDGDGAGFPDLVLVRERLVVAELKSISGRLTGEQDAWLVAFRLANIESYMWRPTDWPHIEKVLE